METKDLENELRNLKFAHLKESELTAYCDEELDDSRRARVEAHLKQCFRCERQLELLRQESAALSRGELSADDLALAERLMRQTGLAQVSPSASPEKITRESPFYKWLSDSLQQMVANWQLSFKAARHSTKSDVVWEWQSADGRLRGRATLAKNADMIVHISSNDMAMEGVRLRFRVGSLNQELLLQPISESEVAAQIAIPWPYRQGNMLTDVSIEIV
jgi:hypothetical protein